DVVKLDTRIVNRRVDDEVGRCIALLLCQLRHCCLTIDVATCDVDLRRGRGANTVQARCDGRSLAGSAHQRDSRRSEPGKMLAEPQTEVASPPDYEDMPKSLGILVNTAISSIGHAFGIEAIIPHGKL